MSQFSFLNVTEEQLQHMIEEVDSDEDVYIDLQEFIEMNTKDILNVICEHMDDLRNAFAISMWSRAVASPSSSYMSCLGEPTTIEGYHMHRCRREWNHTFYAHISNDSDYGSA